MDSSILFREQNCLLARMYEFFFSFFAERMYEFTVYKMRSIVDIRLNFDY